jgi:amino-acid N-acetyltransferase
MQHDPVTTPEPPLTVRQADRSDLPAIARLLEHWADRGRLLSIAHEELERQVERFVVAILDGRIIACGGLDGPRRGVAELRSLAVDPAVRRIGAGRAVAERLLAEARRTGARRVAVLTFETRFFERLGFEHHDERVGASLHAKPNTLGNARMSLALEADGIWSSGQEIDHSEIHPSTTQDPPIDRVSS